MNASDAKTTVRVVAVMTAHNRRALTLASLERLEVAARVAGVTVAAVLMDDGSTDGTAEAVRQRHPWVEVLVGQGDLFWNRGMHAAQAQAMRHAFDYLLWLNDDTALHDDALARYDVLVMPTTPMKAQPIPGPEEPLAVQIQRAFEMVGNTCPFDTSGHPAMSVPCGLSQGLPVGMMLIGKQYQESTIYRAAGAFEALGDWRAM